jgi:hypothetical protein
VGSNPTATALEAPDSGASVALRDVFRDLGDVLNSGHRESRSDGHEGLPGDGHLLTEGNKIAGASFRRQTPIRPDMGGSSRSCGALGHCRR